MRTRSWRRAQRNRVLKKAYSVAKDMGFNSIETRMMWAKQNANNLAHCSCSMCGNPRRYYGDKTKQELICD
jgi:hypothetical protein